MRIHRARKKFNKKEAFILFNGAIVRVVKQSTGAMASFFMSERGKAGFEEHVFHSGFRLPFEMEKLLFYPISCIINVLFGIDYILWTNMLYLKWRNQNG